VSIFEKGMNAFNDGVPLSGNPYLGGYRGHGTCVGGNLQKQRREYWSDGWRRAAAESPKEVIDAACPHCGSSAVRRDVASGRIDCVCCGAGWRDSNSSLEDNA
jgi:hypothetical protein